ncbi:unnamed protein product [Closterium sp. NIES-65]|nr:unnamed protein product [Closterium sp. NIES-65]
MKSRAFPRITSVTVLLSNTLRDYLLAGIGATCGQLKELKLLTVDWESFEATASGWRSLARQCPHLTHLELSSRFARNTSRRRYEDRTALPPLHAFPSLRAVTLGFHPKEISPLLRCSALTSLSLWQPTGGDLACLASPCFSPSFRSSLQSLTIQSGNLTNYLPRVSSFTSLSSLSLESCTFNPCELHSLSRSLHSLTHLTIDNCPSVCGRAVAAMVRANPSLSSLSLSGSSYRLFSSKPLSAVLRLSSRKLQTLTLAGLPSFRPGMLAGCSSLESLTLERTEGSLEGLLGMLVRADEAGGLMARRVDTPADGEYRAGAIPDGPHHLMLERDPSDGIPEVSREELFATLDGLYQQLRPHQSAMRESVEALLAGEDVEGRIVGAVAAAGGAVAAAGGSARGGASPAQQQQSFESIALAAVFGGLRRLAVVACGGVGEEQLRAVLRACRVLVELRVERSDAMSDALLRACPIDTLTHATLIACNGITSAGVIGLLESFPRLRQLKVEADKVAERARRKLLRAGAIIRGV